MEMSQCQLLLCFNLTLYILLFGTLLSHGTDLRKFLGFNCTYDPFNNLLSIFPTLEKSSVKFKFEMSYCLSKTKNRFCTENATWKFAECDVKQSKCSLSLPRKYSTYVFRIVLENKFNRSVDTYVLRHPEKKCGELRAEITEISLTDRNQFLIQWEVSKVCGPGIFLSISDSEGKEIEKRNLDRSNKRARIGDNLRQCTMYKICIIAIDCLSKHKCYNKRTKNLRIPKMNDLMFSENLVKNTLEFYWTDPSKNADTSSLNVFYNYTLFQGLNNSVEASVYSTKLSLPRPKVSRVVFSVKLCTPCGCGEEVSKEFQLKRQTPEKIARRAYASNRLPLIAGVTSVSVILVLFLTFFVLWRTRNNNDSSNDTPPVVEDITEPDTIFPLAPVPPPDEITENSIQFREAGHYDKLGENDPLTS